MAIYIRRQISALSAQGSHSSLPDCTAFPFRLTDIEARDELKLDDDKMSSGHMSIAAATNFALPVPSGYNSANNLAVMVRSSARCKVVIVDPALGTSSFLIKATEGSTLGTHAGIMFWQGRVTSVTVSVPVAFDTAQIDYFMYEVPDLTIAASWKEGSQTIGAVVT